MPRRFCTDHTHLYRLVCRLHASLARRRRGSPCSWNRKCWRAASASGHGSSIRCCRRTAGCRSSRSQTVGTLSDAVTLEPGSTSDTLTSTLGRAGTCSAMCARVWRLQSSGSKCSTIWDSPCSLAELCSRVVALSQSLAAWSRMKSAAASALALASTRHSFFELLPVRPRVLMQIRSLTIVHLCQLWPAHLGILNVE